MIRIKIEITNKPFAVFLVFVLLSFLHVQELASDNTTLTARYPAPRALYNTLTVTGNAFLATLGGSVLITGGTTPSASFDSSNAKLKVAGESRAASVQIAGKPVLTSLSAGNAKTTVTRNADGSYTISGACN